MLFVHLDQVRLTGESMAVAHEDKHVHPTERSQVETRS